MDLGRGLGAAWPGGAPEVLLVSIRLLVEGPDALGGTPVARHRATDSSSGGSPASASPAQVVAHTRSG